MAAAGSLRLKVECLIDGKMTSFVHTASPSDLVSAVLQASATQLRLNASQWNVCKNEGRTDILAPATTLESNGIKSGSKLWLGKIGGEKLVSIADVDSKARPRLDAVDEELIRDHGQKVYAFTSAEKSSVVTADQCPVDPWDERVMTCNGKALSTKPFHAWLCEHNALRDKSLRRSALRELDEPKFRESAKDKAARSITTSKDMASLIRTHELKLQKYRHVDAVVFETPNLLRPIIDFATGQGCQRVAWLYGTYERYPYVPAIKESKGQAAVHAVGFPLGIRTVVRAVFEPMQISSKVHIEFGLDAQAVELTAQADEIAAAAGLKRVGFMFTDLEPDASKPRRYLEKRHAGTYALKSNEVVLAAHLQSMFPNRCDFAESGYAGSKFSTVVLSGNSYEQDNIEPRAYQVSDVAMHLKNQNIFVHSGQSNQLKVVHDDPEVSVTFEWERDKTDGNPLAGAGAPSETVKSSQTNRSGSIPSDYFVVSIPASGFSSQQRPLFFDNDRKWICSRPDFDRENKARLLANQVQKVRQGASALVELCDFNLLVFAASTGIVPMEEIKALTKQLTLPEERLSQAAVEPIVDENIVKILLQSEAWEAFVSSCL